MSTRKDLLFELGCEELPPKSLLTLSNSLKAYIQSGLETAGLDFKTCKAYATPRRLAVLVTNLASAQADKCITKRGPAVMAAFTADGKPSKATEGFAKSCGTTFEQLGRLKTDKGEWLTFTQNVIGAPAEALLPDIIRKSLHNLPIAKRMRWGENNVEFVRPVHWVVLLYGEQTLSADILGITAGNTTRGHRFHAPHKIVLTSPASYPQALYDKGKVIVDFEQRKTLIRESAQQAAINAGGQAIIDNGLLDEITALNEWPVPITGSFDEDYLNLPAEVLITTMQINQKYFPLKNSQDGLLPYFITFSNIESSHPESIKQGNERVIIPRLADADFFWKQDSKHKLEERIPDLCKIIFQQKLGTLAEKTQRVVKLTDYIADCLNNDPAQAVRAAQLAKTDLMTEMVGEFASLQGIMGRYYAVIDGESREVALALEEQYFPKQAGSPTASSRTGQILAIAEKVDTLCGIFSIGSMPTGDKDPYALRRAALGILRTIIENQLDLDLVDCIDFALKQFEHVFDKAQTRRLVLDFIDDRLKSYTLDHGFTADEFAAVLSLHPSSPLDFQLRLQAVKAFRKRPEAVSLSAANKRIRNILKKSTSAAASEIGPLLEDQEIQLLNSAQTAAKDLQPLLAKRDYQSALNRLALLHDDVDAFFDHIMVMTEDIDLRKNRLALLKFVVEMFWQVADISKLQT